MLFILILQEAATWPDLINKLVWPLIIILGILVSAFLTVASSIKTQTINSLKDGNDSNAKLVVAKNEIIKDLERKLKEAVDEKDEALACEKKALEDKEKVSDEFRSLASVTVNDIIRFIRHMDDYYNERDDDKATIERLRERLGNAAGEKDNGKLR